MEGCGRRETLEEILCFETSFYIAEARMMDDDTSGFHLLTRHRRKSILMMKTRVTSLANLWNAHYSASKF